MRSRLLVLGVVAAMLVLDGAAPTPHAQSAERGRVVLNDVTANVVGVTPLDRGRTQFSISIDDGRSGRHSSVVLENNGTAIEAMRMFERSRLVVITSIAHEYQSVTVIDAPRGFVLESFDGYTVRVSSDARIVKYVDPETRELKAYDVRTLSSVAIESPLSGTLRILRTGNMTAKRSAIGWLEEMPSLRQQEEVQKALIDELQAHVTGPVYEPGPGDSDQARSIEYLSALVRVVGMSRNLEALPLLVKAPVPTLPAALGRFGDAAAPHIAERWFDQRADLTEVNRALLVAAIARLLQEPDTTLRRDERVRMLIVSALRSGSAATTVNAIPAALLMRDERLLEIVQDLASGTRSVGLRGLRSAKDRAVVQEAARRALASTKGGGYA